MLNQYDQLIIPRAQSMLRQGEALLHMGVARNDANLAGQMLLVAAVGVKIIPPLFFLVTTNQRLLAFKCPGYTFSGAPKIEIEDVIVVEYAQSRLVRTGTTTLGGQDLFFQTPAGELRFSVVRQMNNMISGGPTTQNQFYMQYPAWLAHQYQTGFASVGQTPTLEMVFSQIRQNLQQQMAQTAWQKSRKAHPKRVKLAILSTVAGLLSVIALIASAVAIENMHHRSGMYDSSHGTNIYVDIKKRRVAALKDGTEKPPSYSTRESAIAYEERELAKEIAEWKQTKQRDEELYDSAIVRLVITLILALLPCVGFVVLRLRARKVPRYVDEDPALAGAQAGSPSGPPGAVGAVARA